MKKLLTLVIFCAVGFTHAHAQFYAKHCNGPDWGAFTYVDFTDNTLNYCSEDGTTNNIVALASQIPAAKPSATGSITNPILGCASPITVTLTGAAVGNGVNISFTGSTAVLSGIIPTAQVTAANTVTVNVCSVISLTSASRPFIVNLL